MIIIFVYQKTNMAAYKNFHVYYEKDNLCYLLKQLNNI